MNNQAQMQNHFNYINNQFANPNLIGNMPSYLSQNENQNLTQNVN